MGKTATRKLTSEERCRKAFENRFGAEPELEPDADYWALNFEGWAAAWKYLESCVTEFIEQ